MKIFSLSLFLLLIISISFTFVHGETSKGDMSVSLNYPGLGFNYFLSDNISLGVKFQTEQDITVTGIRGYYYLSNKSGINYFAGAEADMTTFTGETGKGTGTALEVFIGGEYFLGKFNDKLSLGLDFGPALINLANTGNSVSVSGTEFVINVSINWYFKHT